MPNYYDGHTLTLHSPVPAGIGQGDFGDEYILPFPRRATTKLADSLKHMEDAIDEARIGRTLEPFNLTVEHGVSANLCDSVAALAKKGRGIEIDISWAEVRPSNVSDAMFKFSDDSADVLTDVANSFRRNEPSFDERITARVVRLEKEPPGFDGKAVMLSMRDDRLVRIRVEFDPQVYDRVIEAFRELRTIALDGDVHPVGNTYELRNPRNLTLMAD